MEVSKAQQLRVLGIASRMLQAGNVDSSLIADIIQCAFQYEEVIDMMEDWHDATDPLMASALIAELQTEVGNIMLLEAAEPGGDYEDEDDALQQ